MITGQQTFDSNRAKKTLIQDTLQAHSQNNKQADRRRAQISRDRPLVLSDSVLCLLVGGCEESKNLPGSHENGRSVQKKVANATNGPGMDQIIRFSTCNMPKSSIIEALIGQSALQRLSVRCGSF